MTTQCGYRVQSLAVAALLTIASTARRSFGVMCSKYEAMLSSTTRHSERFSCSAIALGRVFVAGRMVNSWRGRLDDEIVAIGPGRERESRLTMQTPKAILTAAFIIGGSVLAHLGYTVRRDQTTALAARLEQERQAKAAAENYKRVQSKEVWKLCLKSMDWKFHNWIDNQIPHPKYSYLFLPWMFLKGFDLSDVAWKDDHHITVRGILAASPKSDGKDERFFSWARNAELRSDGVDSAWVVDDPAFQDATLTDEQRKTMPMFAIVLPTSEHPRGEATEAVR